MSKWPGVFAEEFFLRLLLSFRRGVAAPCISSAPTEMERSNDACS